MEISRVENAHSPHCFTVAASCAGSFGKLNPALANTGHKYLRHSAALPANGLTGGGGCRRRFGERTLGRFASLVPASLAIELQQVPLSFSLRTH
jgi:hypothetical protein